MGPESFSFKQKNKGGIQRNKNSLAYARWEFKCHIIFAPRFRRKVIYNQIKDGIGKILRALYDRKGVEIIVTGVCRDYICL